MALFQSFTGFSEETPNNFVFDVGTVVVNFNEDALRSTGINAAVTTPWTWSPVAGVSVEVTPTPLGATRGGATFDLQKEERQIEVNGLRVPMIKLDRVDSMAPMISMTLLELKSITTLKYAMGQATVTETDSGYSEVVPKIDISALDYIPNIALLTRTSDEDQSRPMIIVVRNAKIIENAPFEFEDPGELAVEANFRGSTTPAEPFLVPCSVYSPTVAGSGS